MTASLTTLISRIQGALGDDGTYFTTAICTAAVRAALSEVNERAPIHAGDLVDVVADQKEYEVTDTEPRAIGLLDVLEKDTDGEDDEPLKFDQYWEDARLWFRLRTALTSGTLVVRYTVPHTVNGLDSEIESTLPAAHDQYLVHGAAYHACIIRGANRTEANNLNKTTPDTYAKLGQAHRKAFDSALNTLSKQYAPVGEPRQDAWNDEYTGRTN